MSVRQICVRLALVLGVLGGGLGVSMSSAHATLPQTVSATLTCEPLDPGPYQTANWHVHIENHDQSNGSLFIMQTDFNPGVAQYLTAGQTMDLVITGRDGLDSVLTVAADGNFLHKFTSNTVCNPPTTSAVFSCPPNNANPIITYSMNNPSPSTYNFFVHESMGITVLKQLTASTATVTETLNKGDSYHGTIELNGKTLAVADGVANCGEDPTTTSTSTSTSSTSTTSTTNQPTTTTTVQQAVAGDTTSTTIANDPTTVPAKSDPPAAAGNADPTSTVAPASAKSLPFTGSSSVPVGLVGLVACVAGAAIMVAVRRKHLA